MNIFLNSSKLESSSFTFKRGLDFICLRRLCSVSISYSTCHIRIPRVGHAKTKTTQTADRADWVLFFLVPVCAFNFDWHFCLLNLQNCVQYIWVCYLSTGCRSAVCNFWFNRRVKNCVGNFLCRLSITSGLVINSKLSDILNTILYLEPIKASHKLRCKQV